MFLSTLAKFSSLLPPANEVWGKVMFLHQRVNLFMEEGASQHTLERGLASQHALERGGSWLPSIHWEGFVSRHTLELGEVGGMHPTRMLSC